MTWREVKWRYWRWPLIWLQTVWEWSGGNCLRGGPRHTRSGYLRIRDGIARHVCAECAQEFA